MIAIKEPISIREYTNGWRVYDIDSHPHGKIYRDPHNNLGYMCYPDEHLMLVNSCGCVNDAGGNRMWRRAYQHVNEAINIIQEDKETFKW